MRSRNFPALAAVVACVVWCCANVARAQEGAIGFFKNVAGNVKIVRGNADIVAAAGTPIMRADVVTSGANSTGGIVFLEGTTLAVGPFAEIEISRYVFQPEAGKYDFAMYVKKGAAVYTSGKLGKLAPEAINLNTPSATVGVRGTRFIIDAD
jgi:hypothetical protein